MAEFDDFGLLTQMARRELIHVLESMAGQKHLAVESSLMRPLDKIATMAVLQAHSCVHVLQFAINEPTRWSMSQQQQQQEWQQYQNPPNRRVYIIRPSVAAVRRIAMDMRTAPEYPYSVIFVPQRSFLCELELEQQGLFGVVNVHELELPLLRLDSHLFSLEHNAFSSGALVDHTLVQLRTVAKALWRLQSLYGLIPMVYGVGEHSVHLNRLMKKLYIELGEPRSSPDQPVGHLFLLDRNLDPVTVLLTGLTYESMLHDTFGISCGKVTFGDEVIRRLKGGGDSVARSKVTVLDNNDAVFAMVRHMHMTAVFPFLSAKAKALQASYERGTHLEHVRQVKQFVSNELRTLRQQHRQLELHVCACEVLLERCSGLADRLAIEHALLSGQAECTQILAHLEYLMCAQRNQWQVLLLACLWSVCDGGIDQKHMHTFRAQFLHAYGHEHLPVLHQLQLRGLLVERTSSSISATSLSIGNSSGSNITTSNAQQQRRPSFKFLRRRMSLVPSGDAELPLELRNPHQMRYVFSGAFTPMLTQIVADTLTNGWNDADLKRTFGENAVLSEQNTLAHADRPPDSRIQKAIVAFFVGGVTYAEVAALNLLAQHNSVRIIVATTEIVQRERFIKQMANLKTFT